MDIIVFCSTTEMTDESSHLTLARSVHNWLIVAGLRAMKASHCSDSPLSPVSWQLLPPSPVSWQPLLLTM